jgi:hypothetical protein
MRVGARLGVLLAALASAARAQICVAPHPSGHAASLDYGVSPMASHTQVEAGFTYGRRVLAPHWIGAGNSLLLDAAWHNGRLDAKNGVADDRMSWRASGGATVVTTVARWVSVCAHAGAGWYLSNGSPGPSRFLDVPVGVGLGLTIPVGGLVLLPFVMPTASYVARFDRADALQGTDVVADNGRDLALTYGGALRVGRLEVRGTWRIRDQRVQQFTFFRMQAVVWF